MTAPIAAPATVPSEPEADRPRLPAGRARRWLDAARSTPYPLLAVVLAAVMWPAWTQTDRMVTGGDAVAIHYPWFVLWRDLLAAGEWPFWNPYSFGGIPAFATLQAGYGYPPHWLLTPLPPIVAMNWLVGLHVLLAGLGAAWCAGRLGATWDGQLLAGLVYALGSATVARMWAGHFSFLETNAWLPIATGLAVEVGRRHGVARLALAVGMMALAGQPEILVFALWWLPFWALAGAMRTGVGRPIRTLLRAGLGIGLGVGLAAFQVLPVLQVLWISNRQVGMDWDFRTGASLPPWHLLELFGPLAFGDPRGGYWPGPTYEWHERLLFVGVVPLLATGYASGRWRWVCWGGAALAIGLAFGRYVPWYAWAQWLPGYPSLRIPSKHLTLAALALALAAGLGLPRLHGRRPAVVALAAALALAAIGLLTLGRLPTDLLPLSVEPTGLPTGGLWPGVGTLLVAAAIMLLPLARTRRALLVGLATFELVLVLQPFRSGAHDPLAIVANARLPEGYGHVATIQGDAIAANHAPILRVRQPGGYVSLFSGGYMSLLAGTMNPGVALSAPPGSEPVLYLLGYEVIVNLQAARVAVLEPPPPRAWVARCVWAGGALEVRQPDFPRRQCITRSGAIGRQEPTPPGPARIVAEGAGRLTVEAAGPGWLVTSQPWYPGWRAHAQEVPLPVEAVDGALVGVELPAGDHRVEVWYRPAGLDLGLTISAAVLLILACAWWLDRRRGIDTRQGSP